MADLTRPLEEGTAELDTYWYVLERKTDDGSLDIDFQVANPNCPAEQRQIKQEIERDLSTVNALYSGANNRQKATETYKKLLAIARVGLVGPNASPAIAADALRAFEADVVNREAGPVKNAYMRKLGFWASGLGGGALLAFFVCDLFPAVPFKQIVAYKSFFVLWAGCMIGTWASFATRRVNLGFQDLVALEEDRVEPALRLLFAGCLTMILGLVFSTGMADIEIGSFAASQLKTSGAVALLTGAFAGISEKVLPSAILSRASTIIPKE